MTRNRALSIAKRDFLDARRAKLLWAPAALYTMFVVLFFYGQSNAESPDFHMVLWNLGGLGGIMFVPLIALVAAYLAVAGERESGTVKFTLSLPVDRWQVVAGKFLSRGLLVLAGLALALLVGIAAGNAFLSGTEFVYDDYGVFVLLTLLYALTYVGIAIGISAATASRSRAIGGAIGFFFVFNLVWNFLPVGPRQMVLFVYDKLGAEPSQHLLDFIFVVSPTGAYLNSMQLFIPEAMFAQMAGGTTPADDPFYLQPEFMPVMLALWVVVPVALGVYRFSNADLG